MVVAGTEHNSNSLTCNIVINIVLVIALPIKALSAILHGDESECTVRPYETRAYTRTQL